MPCLALTSFRNVIFGKPPVVVQPIVTSGQPAGLLLAITIIPTSNGVSNNTGQSAGLLLGITQP